MIENHAQGREEKELIYLHQGDEQDRTQHLEERDSRLSMQIPGDAALPEIAVYQREQIHARTNRHDVAQSQVGVETANDPGQTKRVDEPVERAERKKDAKEFQYRRLLERRTDLGNRDAPEDQRER